MDYGRAKRIFNNLLTMVDIFKKIIRALVPMIFVFALAQIIGLLPGEIYTHYPWLDIPLHLAGGFTSAWAGFILYRTFQNKLHMRIEPHALLLFIFISFTALIGILWEIYEMIHDFIYPINLSQASNLDTMGDLICDLIGSIAFCILFLKTRLKNAIAPAQISMNDAPSARKNS